MVVLVLTEEERSCHEGREILKWDFRELDRSGRDFGEVYVVRNSRANVVGRHVWTLQVPHADYTSNGRGCVIGH